MRASSWIVALGLVASLAASLGCPARSRGAVDPAGRDGAASPLPLPSPVPSGPDRATEPRSPPSPTLAPGLATTIAKVETERGGRALLVTHGDGSLFKIRAGRHQLFVGVAETSQDRRWLVVEWTDPSSLGGSLGGRIETMKALVSVEHRRVIDPAALGLGAIMDYGFEQQGKVEVLRYSVAGEKSDRTIEFAQLDQLVSRVAEPPHSRKTKR